MILILACATLSAMFTLKNIPDMGDRIRYVRESFELSQVELAKIAGTSQQAIQQAEAGKAKTPRYLHHLSLSLDIPYEWLAMNIMPGKVRGAKAGGFSEKGQDVLDTFFSMSKKEQTLMLELMKARKKKRSSRFHRRKKKPPSGGFSYFTCTRAVQVSPVLGRRARSSYLEV